MDAAVRLLAYAASLMTGIGLASALTTRLQLSFAVIFAIAAAQHTAGFALLSTLPNTLTLCQSQYGYSILAGLGNGLTVGTILDLVPVADAKDDRSKCIRHTALW